jgi:hypothetical protein
MCGSVLRDMMPARQNEEEGHTNARDPLMMVVASALVAADVMHAEDK